MPKISYKELETIKSQLITNVKVLKTLNVTPVITKLIKGNEKQIKILSDEHYID